MFHTILFFITAFIFCILSPLFWLLMWIVHFFSTDARDRLALTGIKFLCSTGRVCAGVKAEYEGLENLPDDHPVLYVVNHRSIFDIILTYPLMKQPTGFVSKDSLKKIPLFSTWITLNHGLFLNRDNIREGMKTILTGIDYIKSGYSMVIFPEGTRNKDQTSKTSLLPFHGGSFKLAEKSGVPIIPITIYNSAECFEAHYPKMTPAKVRVNIGKPVIISELSKENQRFLSQYVQDIMQETLNAFEK